MIVSMDMYFETLKTKYTVTLNDAIELNKEENKTQYNDRLTELKNALEHWNGYLTQYNDAKKNLEKLMLEFYSMKESLKTVEEYSLLGYHKSDGSSFIETTAKTLKEAVNTDGKNMADKIHPDIKDMILRIENLIEVIKTSKKSLENPNSSVASVRFVSQMVNKHN